MISTPNASYSFTARLELTNKIGMFSQVVQAVAEAAEQTGVARGSRQYPFSAVKYACLDFGMAEPRFCKAWSAKRAFLGRNRQIVCPGWAALAE